MELNFTSVSSDRRHLGSGTSTREEEAGTSLGLGSVGSESIKDEDGAMLRRLQQQLKKERKELEKMLNKLMKEMIDKNA